MSEYFLGNNNFLPVTRQDKMAASIAGQPLFGNLAWLLAKNYCYLEYSDIKCCYLELSRQQVSCCRVLSRQQLKFIYCRENTRQQVTSCRESTRQQLACCGESSR